MYFPDISRQDDGCKRPACTPAPRAAARGVPRRGAPGGRRPSQRSDSWWRAAQSRDGPRRSSREPPSKGHRRWLSGVIATVNLVLVATAGRPISIDISALLASSNILPRPQSFTVARIKPCMGGRRRSRASGGCEPLNRATYYSQVHTLLYGPGSSHLISSFYLIVSHLI